MNRILNLVIIITLLSPKLILAQRDEKDNILTLSIVKEPITLQKSRLQVNAGYQYEMYWKHFNDYCQQINVVDYGQVGSLNQFNYQIKYGLTDCLQVELHQGFKSGYYGSGTVIKVYFDDILNTTFVTEINGFSDLLLNLGYRIPLNLKTFEIAFFPGIYLPAKHDPDKPVYEINKTRYEEEDNTWINLDQKTNLKAGSGALRFEFASKAKLRLNDKIAFQLYGKYNSPFKDVNSVHWKTIYDGILYNHINERCKFSPKKELFGNFELQVVPDKKEIMGLFLGVNILNFFDEWTTVDDFKLNVPNSSMCRIYTGLELVVTEKIRFNQQFFYDVAGRNINGALGMQSSFTFNFLRNEK